MTYALPLCPIPLLPPPPILVIASIGRTLKPCTCPIIERIYTGDENFADLVNPHVLDCEYPCARSLLGIESCSPDNPCPVATQHPHLAEAEREYHDVELRWGSSAKDHLLPKS